MNCSLQRCAREVVSVFAAAALLAPLVGLGASTARAEYPDKSVRIILPYGPGGVADVTTRLVAQKLGERLGKQFIVDNRPGAGGIVAALAVVSAARDGYTIFLTGNGTAISMSLFKSLPYDIIRDFTSISLMAKFDVLLAIKGEFGAGFGGETRRLCQRQSGQAELRHDRARETQHLSAELFKILTGMEAAVVTYSRLAGAHYGAVARRYRRRLRLLCGVPADDHRPKLKIIATAGEQPSPLLPGIPTVKDTGYPDYTATSWNALAFPAGVPPEIMAKLNHEIEPVLKKPDVQERAVQFGMEAVGSTPDELTARMKSDIVKWGQVIEKIGLPKQ